MLCRPSKEETGIVNVEFYCTDSKILRPGNGSRRFDFNFYASKLFHSGFGTVSGMSKGPFRDAV